MWIAPFLAIAAALYLLRCAARSAGGRRADPAPVARVAAARLVAQPAAGASRRRGSRRQQTAFLRLVARKTWAFFETFVGPDDHWLPPDNFQESPAAVLAHRTSPTNMGLALLANLSAYDFGYVPAGQLLERTRNAFATMHKLERYRGHFYNWYDTQSLQPLLPAVCLHGRQRQPRRPPADAAAGPRRAAGPADPRGALARRARRHASRPCSPPRRSACRAPCCASSRSSKRRWRTGPPRSRGARGPRTAGGGRGAARERLDDGIDREADDWARALDRQCRDARRRAGAARATGSDAGLRRGSRRCASWRRKAARPPRARMEEIAQLVAAGGRDGAHGLRLPVRRRAAPAGDRLQRGRPAERRRDASYYDLLASEARLAGFVAIAQGQLPQQSWFALGRLLVNAGSGPTLLSWSGSMFEYLMPLLVMPTYDNTLLDESCRAAVRRQIEYGAQRGVPWGMSESGYNTVDAALNYQYRAFGVPGLGLKRGLSEDLVIAPYATRARADGRARSGLREPAAARGRRHPRQITASTRRSTTRRRACAARKPAPSCVRSWPTTRA